MTTINDNKLEMQNYVTFCMFIVIPKGKKENHQHSLLVHCILVIFYILQCNFIYANKSKPMFVAITSYIVPSKAKKTGEYMRIYSQGESVTIQINIDSTKHDNSCLLINIMIIHPMCVKYISTQMVKKQQIHLYGFIKGLKCD